MPIAPILPPGITGSLFDSHTNPSLQKAVQALAEAEEHERGAIFTRPEVVAFVLDLAGYTVDRPLHQYRLLELSFGKGDFLRVIIDRLLAAYQRYAPDLDENRTVSDLGNAIRAVPVAG